MAGRWSVRKDVTRSDDPFPWFVLRSNYEELDPDSDLAAIEGGSHATQEQAARAADFAARLDPDATTRWDDSGGPWEVDLGEYGELQAHIDEEDGTLVVKLDGVGRRVRVWIDDTLVHAPSAVHCN